MASFRSYCRVPSQTVSTFSTKGRAVAPVVHVSAWTPDVQS